jgi:hypothetical protein
MLGYGGTSSSKSEFMNKEDLAGWLTGLLLCGMILPWIYVYNKIMFWGIVAIFSLLLGLFLVAVFIAFVYHLILAFLKNI